MRHLAARGGTLLQTVQGVLVVVLLVVGFWQGIAALASPAARVRLAAVLDGPSLLTGRAAAAVNTVMAHDLPAGGLLRAAGGVFRWRVFGSGGPQVSVGCGDWLYLTEELRPWPGAETALRTRADLVRRVAGMLQAKGIALTVALVPDKARVQDATLCGAPYSAEARGRYAAFQALLRGAHVPVVDLDAVLSGARRQRAVYYRTDTHWNQFGASLAARAVAAAAGSTIVRDAAYETETASREAERPGDLLRLMSLDAVPDRFIVRLRPRPDLERVETTRRTSAPPDQGGLLDTPEAPQVVLLGSSYSLNANFLGRLQESMGTEVVSFARAGGGFAGAARAYFASLAFRETPPKLVIWEFPERVLAQPLGADEQALAAINHAESAVPPQPRKRL